MYLKKTNQIFKTIQEKWEKFSFNFNRHSSSFLHQRHPVASSVITKLSILIFVKINHNRSLTVERIKNLFYFEFNKFIFYEFYIKPARILIILISHYIFKLIYVEIKITKEFVEKFCCKFSRSRDVFGLFPNATWFKNDRILFPRITYRNRQFLEIIT